MDRKLATIEKVTAVAPIPDADAIESAHIRGWDVVVKKGDVWPGDLVVYIEIDTALPLADPLFAFLAPRGEKVIDMAGVPTPVHVLRTAKLRGQVSQGLAIPFDQVAGRLGDVTLGQDVTDVLGLTKYEPPIPPEMADKAVGPFPTSLIPKTRAERVQNLTDFGQLAASTSFYATEKIDGQSVTMLNVDGTPRLGSRNWELAWSEDLTAVRVFTERGTIPDEGWAVQAEVFGEGDGLHGNPLRIKGQAAAIFGVFRRYGDGPFTPVPRADWPQRFLEYAVPTFDLTLPGTVAEAVAQADGIASLVAPGRKAEGIVWHTVDGSTPAELNGRTGFKVISNAYLLKHGG